MPNLFTDFKRAWRLTKLIRAGNLSDEEALQIEKIDSIYIQECRDIRSSLEKANQLLKEAVQDSKLTLSKRLNTTRISLNRKLKDSAQGNDARLSKFEDSVSSAITKASQLLAASKEAYDRRLSEFQKWSEVSMESHQETRELVDDIRDYVSKQASETRRWQEGYDWRILKNYLMAVASTIDNVEAQLEGLKRSDACQEIIKKFDFLRETLEIHLEEEGMMSYSPKLGNNPDPVRDEIKLSAPSNSEEEIVGTIAEVIRKGYEIDLGSDQKIIRKAQVTVYKK